MADLNPEVFEDLQVAERTRPVFEAAGLRLRTWEAYALAFNERILLRRELDRIAERRGSPDIHPEVVERLQALRTELDPMVGRLRKFLPPEPPGADDRERQEMVLGFIAVSPAAREVAAKWIADPERYRNEATQKLVLIEAVVEKYRRALRAEIDAQMTSPAPVAPPPPVPPSEPIPQPGPVTSIMRKRPGPPLSLEAPASLEASATNGEVSLIWAAVPNAAVYAVKRASLKGGPYSTIARPAQDCYADLSLQNGATYYYIVAAVDAAGAEGPPSAEIEATPLAPPIAPATLAATPGNGRVSLAWSPSAGAARYKLMRATTPAGPYSIAVSTPDLTFIDTTVANGTTYFYSIIAQNKAGESPSSPVAQAMPVAPPPPPVGLTATPGNGRVTLSWTPVHGATCYTLRRSTDPAGPFAIVAGPPVPTCVDGGVMNGTTYYYAVSALNSGGESPPGTPVPALPVGAPPAPSGLAAYAGNGEVLLSWAAVPGASCYAVRRAGTAEGPWTDIAVPAVPTYTDTGLANGVAAFYTVASQNAGGESAPCAAISAVPVSPPPSPTGLAASAGNTRVTLTWEPTPGASFYVLKRGTTPGGPHESVATPTGTTHVDLLLTNNATYYYTLAAKNAGGESGPSAEVSATPVGPPGAPVDLEAAAGNGKVTLRWRPVATADGYRVMRSTTPSGPYSSIANPVETGFIDTGVATGTEYYYVVRAANGGGKGPYSPEVKAVPVAPPATPQGLAVTGGNGILSLTWTEVPGATSYTLHRAGSPEGPFTELATLATPSAVDTQVTNGTTYYYAVSASNAGGESARSAAVSAIPLAPPGVPSGLSAFATNGVVSLSWNPAPRALGYRVRRATTATGPFEPIGASVETTFDDATVTNGTTYHYSVCSQNDGGESAPSTPVAATPVAAPRAPTGLQISSGNGRVAISWSPAPRATSYSVRRSSAAGGPYVPIAAPAIPQHLDTDVKNGTTWYYVITALNAGGESGPSAEASATPIGTPGLITAVEAVAGNGQVSLHWPAAENATGYVVKRSLEAEGTFTPIASVPACNYVDAGLTNGTPYHYRVNSLNAGGGGLDSATASATPVAPPPAPTGLAASAGNHEIELKWVAAPRATNYLVKRAEASGGPYVEIATVVGPGHHDTRLENGQTYYYVVTAVNAGGESAPSAEAQSSPVEPPGVPTNLTAVAGNNQVLLNWSAVPGATYYRVKRATDKRGPYVTAATVARTSTIDNGVENGKTYHYVVLALNAGGRSAHSVRVAATPVPPPPAPSNVVALAGNVRISLTWSGVSSATGYSIKRATSPNGPFTTIARVPETSYLDRAVTNGTTYYYVVRSATGVIKGPLSPQVQATPAAPPATPGNVSAAPGHGTITLTWNGSPGATCYHVKRAGSQDGPFETIASPARPVYEDTGLSNGLAYYYRVSAENAGGESSDTTPLAASPVAPPAVPAGLQAMPAGSEVSLAWTPVPGAVQYRVKRAESLEGPFSPVAQPADPGYTDTGLVNGRTYHYVVSAINAHGESFDSAPAQATPVGAPATPLGLTAMAGSGKIDLSWTPVASAVRYRVVRSASPGGPYTLVATPHTASYSDFPLTNGIPQYYVVSAVNAGGESHGSVEITAAPGAAAGGPKPAGLPTAAPAAPPPAAPAEEIPTLESIPMPAGQKMQGIDLERLLDLRRVEQIRTLFQDTAQKFEEWEVLTLIAEEGHDTRRTMELLLRLKNQGNVADFTSGAVALFDKILGIRAQHAGFVRKLRAFLEELEVKAPSRAVFETALGFILQASKGRTRAVQWVERPDDHRRGASEYMKMAYTIARKYQDAL
jgi:fibronectin type 3 domain-containing protein